jgi:hypothetical protein
MVALTALACSDDQASGPASDPDSDPMNYVVELGRPVERGYDRTGWELEPLEAALALARRTTDTTVGCIDPGEVNFDQVKSSNEKVMLPMPGAHVQCYSNGEDEDLLFTGFVDEESKNTYIEAKAELICGRALSFGSDTSRGQAGFDGIVYVDAGLVIIEPDSYVVRDLLAQELGATASKMCPEAVGDRPPTTPASTGT